MVSTVSVLLAAAGCAQAFSLPQFCLPPVFEGGQRLHQLPAPTVFWLELLLRQHEICWRAPERAGEVRVALFGSSAVFGFPLRVEESFGALLNTHFALRKVPAHLFNLAFAYTYQVRDAVIIRESLAYGPDVLLYATALADFQHVAPILFRGVSQFFDSNSSTILELAADPPAGLAEPIQSYRRWVDERKGKHGWWPRFREVGSFVRTGARLHARSVAAHLYPGLPQQPPRLKGRQLKYDCGKTAEAIRRNFANWQDWNVLAYLEQVRKQTGAEVLVVNWPVAHEPVGDCYNVRYTNAVQAQFDAWLGAEADRRGFHYLDLHDLLKPEEFLDSLHISPPGHRKLAGQVAPILDSVVLDVAERKGVVQSAEVRQPR